jgi:hypothetical protein
MLALRNDLFLGVFIWERRELLGIVEYNSIGTKPT